MTQSTVAIPRAFVWRRLHSLTGLWLVLFLIEHLLTNSQAALWIGDSGAGFVRMVNALHNLPYLQVIEIFLLGVPFAIHMYWGVIYLFTAKSNAHAGDGSKPRMREYGRNRAYSWQRITSWILLFMIIGHVVKFRFLDYPKTIMVDGQKTYMVTVSDDPGLQSVAERLGVQVEYISKKEVKLISSNFGTVTLFEVRDTFKKPIYIFLYTIFVLAAAYHGFNGFWTFLISWGAVLKMSSQKSMVRLSIALMLIIAFLGLASVWGTYWINLKS